MGNRQRENEPLSSMNDAGTDNVNMSGGCCLMAPIEFLFFLIKSLTGG